MTESTTVDTGTGTQSTLVDLYEGDPDSGGKLLATVVIPDYVSQFPSDEPKLLAWHGQRTVLFILKSSGFGYGAPVRAKYVAIEPRAVMEIAPSAATDAPSPGVSTLSERLRTP